MPLLSLLLAGACSLRSTAGLSGGGAQDGPVVVEVDAPSGSPSDGSAESPNAPALDGGVNGNGVTGDAGADGGAGGEADGAVDGAPGSDGGASDRPPAVPDAAAPLVGRVVLVVGNLVLSPSDTAIQKRLADRGLTVVLAPDSDAPTLSINGVDLVFVSPSVLSTRIAGAFRELRRPLIVSEPLVFDETGMVDPMLMDSRGTAARETALEILAPGNPIAAGLSGMITITTAPVTISWGLPPAASQRLANVAARPDRIAIFTYEAGAAMVGLNAPARRVGFFLSVNTAASLTAEGWALLDAAVTWALGGPAGA